MVINNSNKKFVKAFRESLQNQVSMRLSGMGIEKSDIDKVVNYMFNRVNGEYVDARYLNSLYHQAISELRIERQPVFSSARFPVNNQSNGMKM